MDELVLLKGKMHSMSAMQATSGMESSPWSTVGVTSDSSLKGNMRASQSARHGRQGSRTPRSKVREHAQSLENGNRKNPAKFTPNGTRVPDGPPPTDVPILPPVPPLPMVEPPQAGETSFGQQPV